MFLIWDFSIHFAFNYCSKFILIRSSIHWVISYRCVVRRSFRYARACDDSKAGWTQGHQLLWARQHWMRRGDLFVYINFRFMAKVWHHVDSLKLHTGQQFYLQTPAHFQVRVQMDIRLRSHTKQFVLLGFWVLVSFILPLRARAFYSVSRVIAGNTGASITGLVQCAYYTISHLHYTGH